jgi:DNA-binding response OmpR family regulator
MSVRAPVGEEHVFALWNGKRCPTTSSARRVLLMHADRTMGESLALLLRLKGFASYHTTTLQDFRKTAQAWEPQAFLLDTRLDNRRQYQLIREISAMLGADRRLFFAISGLLPEDDVATLKAVGYDGHMRRPSSLWGFVQALQIFYAY